MIDGCIEKLKKDLCGGCERRDACGFHWSPGKSARPSRRAGDRPGRSRRGAFFILLSEIAKAIEGQARTRRAPFRKEVERRIEPLLASGEVSAERLAREMGYSRQTLYRRLKAEGATFEQILDDLRRHVARRLLRDDGLSVKEAAYRLGFSEPAAFSRAFKRWTGASPTSARGAA